MASGSSAMSLIATTKYWDTGPSSTEPTVSKSRLRQQPMTYADNFNYLSHFYKPMIEYLDKKITGTTPISRLQYPTLPLTTEGVLPEPTEETSGIRRVNSYTKAQINRFINTSRSSTKEQNLQQERKPISYLAKNYSFGKLSVQQQLLSSSPTINKYASGYAKKTVKFEPISLHTIRANEGLIKRIHSFSSFTDKAKEDVKREIESTELRSVLHQCKRNYEELAVGQQPRNARFTIGNPQENEIKHWKDLSEKLSLEIEAMKKRLADTEFRARNETNQLRKQLQNEVVNLTNSMEMTNKTNESLVEKNRKLMAQNKDLKAENDQLRSALQNSTELCNSLQLKFQRLLAEHGDLQTNVAFSKRFQKRAEELYKEAQEQSDEFSRLMLLKTRLHPEKPETKNTNVELENTRSFEHLKTEMEKIQRLYHGEQLKVMELQSQNQILLSELKNLESKLVNVKTHLVPQGKILNELESKLMCREDELKVERKKSEALTRVMSSKDKRIQELHNNLEAGSWDSENLQAALNQVEKKANAYKKQLQDLNPGELRPLRLQQEELIHPTIRDNQQQHTPYKTLDRNKPKYELPKIRRSRSLAQPKSGI